MNLLRFVVRESGADGIKILYAAIISGLANGLFIAIINTGAAHSANDEFKAELVAAGLLAAPNAPVVQLALEHPMGVLDVSMEIRSDGEVFDIISAGLVRTARKLAAGEVFIPGGIWDGN